MDGAGHEGARGRREGSARDDFCVRDVARVVDGLAPFDLAEPWDRVGLQVGSPGAPVTGVLVALEADADGARRPRGAWAARWCWRTIPCCSRRSSA